MKRHLSLSVALLTTALSLAIGCAEPATVNRVGVNVVQKSLFTGSWYFSSTVIDVDYESAGIGTYPGDSAIDFGASDLGSIPRVRWVIDEDTLFAYRDYEILEGGNPSEVEPGDYLGQPVAAFMIESHFDIRRAYSTVTGEEQNVLVENATDRRWYEREYMRVNWSKNLLPAYYGQIANLYEILGLYNREPADLFIQGASEFPDSWQPTFDFMACQGIDDTSAGCSAGERDLAEDYNQGDLYHFSFVTQEIISPGQVPNPFGPGTVQWCTSVYGDAPACNSNAVFVRNAFLKVSDTRQYVPENWLDTRFERHGYFRVERLTVDRARAADEPGFGITDFLNYNANRHNIWRDWYDEAGNSIPYAERRTRPIVYYTSHEVPGHLMKPSHALIGSWNEVFMRTVRDLKGLPSAEYPRIDCQTEDPEAYCYCTSDGGEVINPTCAGLYDPFETPEAAAARGVVNPYQCHVNVPEGAEPDMNRPDLSDIHFFEWFNAEQEGDECMVELRVNNCNRAAVLANGGTFDGLDCQERGDMRYKLLSYVDQPGTRFLGVATLRGDPVTGELIVGDANIGGPALDGYRTFALQNYDLLNGALTDRDFILGEDVRGYLENLERVQLPATPQRDFNVAIDGVGEMDPGLRNQINNQMGRYLSRAADLSGPEGRANTYIDRRNTLAGTPTERRLMENPETLMLAGIDVIPEGITPSDIGDEILNRVSPFRTDVSEQVNYWRETETKISSANVMMPNEFVDNSVLEFVNNHRDWERGRLEISLNRNLYFETQLHELGHCLGLRHSFGSSADPANYFDEYYHIRDRVQLPDPRDFDIDGTNGLSVAEQRAYEADYQAAKERQELLGIDKWMNTSVMEYTAQWYERTVAEAGKYDHAAISFGYGDLVEVYDNEAGLEYADITPINTERSWVKYYHGGEVCETDAECPFNGSGSRSGELLESNLTAGLVQTCSPHPAGSGHGSICTNFDDDMEQAAIDDPSPRWAPVEYRYCTDDRVGSIGWCHRFDEGDSYREVVRNIGEQFQRQYLWTNFRRYRSSFSIGNYLFGRLIGRQYNILQAVFHSMLYQYQTDEDFRSSEGAFGFYDQFMATADILNFYGSVLATPDIGTYRWNEGWERYQRVSVDPDAPGAQLRMPLGTGRYLSTTYQRGLSGITRIERIGSFYEKWFTMQMLTSRGFGAPSYTRDVPYWTNFYDLFPVEMQQLFQGLIADQPEAIAPRIACNGGTFPTCLDPELVYMNLYRGDCSDPSTCRPAPEDTYAGLPVLEFGAFSTIQFLAAVYALADFPVFFDTSFQNQLFICVEGQGDCHRPDADAVEGTDYITYASPRYGKTFIAWQVEPTVAVPNAESIGFQMVEEAGVSACLVQALRTYRGDFGGAPNDSANLSADDNACLADASYSIPSDTVRLDNEIERLDDRLRELESFFFQIIQLERDYGIANYLRF